MTAVRLGTRGSILATTQSGQIANVLRGLGLEVELVIVVTDGDVRAADTPWGEGAFVAALERGLLEGSVDVAVHSAKDVPLDMDLPVVAYPSRVDPRDALVGRESGVRLADLPEGAVIGTDSPRRTGFLRAERPDLRIVPLHGNVDTRLRKLDDGQVDALVLAIAGLERLGHGDRIGERIPAGIIPSAPGQGALAVQVSPRAPWIADRVAALDDPATRRSVECERALLRAFGGGCRAPLGAIVDGPADRMLLTAGAVRPDGTARAIVERMTTQADAGRLAVEIAGHLRTIVGDLSGFGR